MKERYAGGQAVIEGVMMMSGNKLAIAARDPKGKIVIKKDKLKDSPFFRFFFIRGIVNLVRMLVIGYKALSWSADVASGEDEKISTGATALVMLVAFAFAIGLFILLPLWLTKIVVTDRGFLFNIIDGIIRVIIFVIYLKVISLMKDVQRIFQYHGAEHMAVNCFEQGKTLTLKNVKKYGTAHVRCGTSFIIVVLVISIFIFSLIFSESFWIKFLARIVLIPVIAGLSYEIIKLGSKYKESLFFRIMNKPGLWIQGMTTRKPDNKQLEVAIKALKQVI